MQTKGGFRPKWRWFEEFWPKNTRLVWLSGIRCTLVWLDHTMGVVSWPLDWISWPLGKPRVRVHDGLLSIRCMWTLYEKIEQIIWGTWGSNPGPSTHQATSLANWAIARVCHMNGKQLLYKKKQILGYQTKQKRARFECPNHRMPPMLLLRLYL